MKKSEWHTNAPINGRFYLIQVKERIILMLGLNPSPPFMIGRFENQKWTPVLGSAGIGLDNINEHVIAWQELPPPISTEQEGKDGNKR